MVNNTSGYSSLYTQKKHGGNDMKKIVLFVTSLTLGNIFTSPTTIFANDLEEDTTAEVVVEKRESELLEGNKLALDQYFEDDENYYVIEPLISKERTWSQAQNYTITKTGRIYLGRFKKGTTVSVSIPIPKVGGKFEVKHSVFG